MGKEELVMKIMPKPLTPYQLVVCEGAVDFVMWPAGGEGHGKHEYMG